MDQSRIEQFLYTRTHQAAALLIGLHLLLAGAYSAWNPLGEAPDEADHWAYVVYLARERSLPQGPRVTQSKHPPLYHAAAAAVALPAGPSTDFLRANPDIAIRPGPTQSPNFFIHTTLESWPWRNGPLAFHLARGWSVLLSTATVAAVYGLARTALPNRPGQALLATGLAAALPELAFLGGAVNNDTGAAFFGALALWGGLAILQGSKRRPGGDWRAGWWTAPALGLGLLTKASTGAIWPVVALCILLGALRRAPHVAGMGAAGSRLRAWSVRLKQTAPVWLGSGLAVFGPAVLIAAPWLLRNWRLYGDPTGMALTRQTIDLRTTPWGWEETVWLLRGWFVSFWGKFGGAGHLSYPGWVYILLLILTALAILGGWRAWRRNRPGALADPSAGIGLNLALLALAALAVAVGIWRYSLIALGTDQGRLLFPGLGALLTLLAAGLAGLPLARRAKLWLGASCVLGLFGLALYGLMGVIGPAFAPPPYTVAPAPAPARSAPVASFGELYLSQVALDHAVTLTWTAPQPPSQDWRTIVRILAEDGSHVWEGRRSPGYGRYSTDHWQAGTRLRDVYHPGWPDWAGPGRYRVEVALYPFGGDPVMPAVEDSDVEGKEAVDGPFVTVGWLERP